MRSRLFPLAVTAALAVGVAGCGHADDSGLFDVSATSRPVTMTSTPTNDSMKPVAPVPLDHLEATVRQVRIQVAGGDDVAQDEPPGGLDDGPDPGHSAHAKAASADESWVTVFDGSRTVDLFDQSATGSFISSSRVPTGSITGMRMVIDDVRFVTPSAAFDVRCPSCAESGLKIHFDQPVALLPGQHARVLLVFERDHTLWLDEHGYVLSPVVHAEVSVAP